MEGDLFYFDQLSEASKAECAKRNLAPEEVDKALLQYDLGYTRWTVQKMHPSIDLPFFESLTKQVFF